MRQRVSEQKNIVWKKISMAVFFLLLTGFCIAGMFLPDLAVSKTERRTLAQKPEISTKNILDGSYMEKLETYLLEQFAGRELFRTLKTETETKILGKSDSGDYYQIGEGIYKLDAELNEKNIVRAANAFSRIRKNAFPQADVYFAVIPDKNYFVAEEHGYPAYDYNRLNELMQEHMQEITNINLYDLLEISDYYRTDLHWKQEGIVDVAEELLIKMNGSLTNDVVEQKVNQSGYQKNQNTEFVDKDIVGQYEVLLAKEDFYGGYAGASAFLSQPEQLQYFVNDAIRNAVVYDYETGTEETVYELDKLEGTDAYDVYLGGARALLTIKNPSNNNGKSLLLFRDSFGSSIAPLFLEEYEMVTLVDFRYISENYLMELLDMGVYDDVLFLYSTTVLNHSDSMKLN